MSAQTIATIAFLCVAIPILLYVMITGIDDELAYRKWKKEHEK